MKITYNPAKREATLAKRGLDFEDATVVFAGPIVTDYDTRHDYGEQRFQTYGWFLGRMVMIVWTPRGEARHIISMRKCNDREKKTYRQRLSEG